MGFELLLPVVLFVLTLAIIFLLRSDDKRNQRADLIKKRAQSLLKNVENSQTQFKESAQKVEERISKKIDESHLLMSNVDLQLADLEARSEDLAVLQKVLTTYQTSLTQLESSTVQVEQRVAVMKAEVAKLARVQESLDDFDLRFEQFKGNVGKQITEGEENIHAQQLRFKELQAASFAKLQEYEREVQQAEQEALAQMAVHAETLKSRQDASLNLVSGQIDKLRLLSEDSDQQMILYEKALQAAHRQANEQLQEQQREFAQVQAKHSDQQKRQEVELRSIEEDTVRHITEEMQGFVQQCYGEMAQIFEMTLKKTDISFQNMIRVASQYLKELSLRLEQAKEAAMLLDASERTSLLGFKEDMNRLLEETFKGEQNLKEMQDMEEKSSSALALLHQEAKQLHESLNTMKGKTSTSLKRIETSPASVVFSMALVDEACKPLGGTQEASEEERLDPAERLEPIVQEQGFSRPSIKSIPSVVFSMALVDEVCKPLEREQDVISEEDVKPVEEPKGTAKPTIEKADESDEDEEEKDDSSTKTKKSSPEKRQVEYLSESEEEILLDEDEDLPL